MTPRTIPCAFLAAAAALTACESSNDGTTATPGGDGGPGDTPVVSKCLPVTGEGTPHSGDLPSANETWTAEGSPHVITSAINIREGQKLTVEPCAVVRLEGGTSILVDGEIVADGAADRRITFERAGDEAWEYVRVSDTGHASFAYATLKGGGYSRNSRPDATATLYVDGDPRSPEGAQPLVRVDHVTIEGSETLGVLLTENAAFTDDSQELTVTGGGSAPARLWVRAATSFPTGKYTGNQDDQLLLEAGGFGDAAVVSEVTVHDRGVPYHVISAPLRVGGDDGRTPGTLVLEPGVTLRFQRGSGIDVQAYTTRDPGVGTLRAIGTADKPITLTSDADTPAPGDWVGIMFEGAPTSGNHIEHAVIAYAGGESGISSYDCADTVDDRGFSNRGAVIFYGDAPTAAFITNTRIEASAQDGIVRGWTGEPVDFLSGNEFVDVSRCFQTFPRPSAGTCPTPPPCPK